MWLRWCLGFGLALTGLGLQDGTWQKNAIVFDDNDNESGAAAASIHDEVPVPEVDTTVTNSFDGEYADETIPEKPAALAMSSEVQQVQHRSVQVEELPASSARMHVVTVPDSVELPHKVSSLASTSQYTTGMRPNKGPLKTQSQMQQEVMEEYDDAEVEGDSVGLPSDSEHVTTRDGETMTYEDNHRKKHGDVDKIVSHNVMKMKHNDPPEWHPPPPVSQASKIRVIPGGPYVPGAFLGRQKDFQSAGQARKNAQARMMSQCKAYTSFLVRAQGPVAPPMGPKVIQMMKATCDGAIKAGTASSQYTLMCNALGSAVEPFIVGTPNWDGICAAVLQVFTESGVGEF